MSRLTFNDSVTTTLADAFKAASAGGPDGPDGSIVTIRNSSASSANLQINCPSLGHPTGVYWELAPGESIDLVGKGSRTGNIQHIVWKAASGTVTGQLIVRGS
jgi:hypothetical protein